MVSRRRASRATRSGNAPYVMQPLEQRSLFSAALGAVVLEAPLSPALPVQVDQSATAGPSHPEATLATTTDIRLRVTPLGIYLVISVSGLNTGDPTPTGTVDISDESGPIGTIALGDANGLSPLRSTLVIPPGEHTFFAIYSGDHNFLISQNSLDSVLVLPTSTLPKSAKSAASFATNTSKAPERVRPMRMLSNVPFGNLNNITVPDPEFSPVTFAL